MTKKLLTGLAAALIALAAAQSSAFAGNINDASGGRGGHDNYGKNAGRGGDGGKIVTHGGHHGDQNYAYGGNGGRDNYGKNAGRGGKGGKIVTK
jgi:hypothetical protein